MKSIYYFTPMPAMLALPVVFALMASVAAAQQQSGTPNQVISRAMIAYGGAKAVSGIADWVGAGQISITGDTAGARNFRIMVKDQSKVLRIVDGSDGQMRYGSDGTSAWQSKSPFVSNAVGPVSYFIEALTKRSVQNLFTATGLKLRDMGTADLTSDSNKVSTRVIEAADSSGRTTRYYVDQATSLIRRLEFDTGTSYTMLVGNQNYPAMAAFDFSDFRAGGGIMTPFKIDLYVGPTRIETLIFESVQYNTGVTDAVFVP